MRYSQTIFSKSAFIRCMLAPVIAIALVFLPDQTDWNATKIVVIAGLELMLGCFLLALISPTRFEWAGGVVAGMVFVTYAVHLGYALWEDPSSLFGRGGDFSALRALVGFFLIGLPGLSIAVSTLFKRGSSVASCPSGC